MKKKTSNVFLYLSVIMIFLITIFNVKNTFAISNKIIIHTGNNKEYIELLGKDKKFRTYKYWEISSKYKGVDKLKIREDLFKYTDDELNAQFSSKEVVGKFDGDKIILENIEDGLYYFRSIISNENNIFTSSFAIELPLDGTRIIDIYDKLHITPKEKGKVKLVKEDQFRNKLKGVGFNLYKIENGVEKSVPVIANYIANPAGKETIMYTDDNGEINVTNLNFGDYVFRETKSLDGFEKEKIEKKFTINSDEIVKFTIVNTRKRVGDFEFLKVGDSKDEPRLKDAKFEVLVFDNGKYIPYYENGNKLILTSGYNGKFYLRNVPFGKYRIREIKAPKGYVLSDINIDFEVNDKSEKRLIVIKNKKDIPPLTPNTGDRGIYLYLILGLAGLILVFLLRYLKNNKNKK